MRIKTPLLMLLCIGAIFVAGLAVAQVSGSYDLRWWAFSGGGGARQSGNYLVQDAMAPLAGDVASSANYQVESGFVAGVGASAEKPTPTPTPTATNTATPVPNAPTNTPTPEPKPGGDAFEDDDVCARAQAINTSGTVQTHTFHDEGDTDWIKFTAEANRSYNIEVNNTGPNADAVLFLHDGCDGGASSTGDNAFGSTVQLTWDATRSGDYYVRLQQFDASYFGNDVTYDVSIKKDTTAPSAPTFPRCLTLSQTSIAVQWKENPERDVSRYRVSFANQSGTFSGVDEALGHDTTYYALTELITGDSYTMRVRALDFSGNVSDPSGDVFCTAQTPADNTKPALTLQQPSASAVHTTTAQSLTFTGLATDSGNNLSRVQVKNVTKDVEGWDYSLSGGSKEFRVEDLAIGQGDNTIEVTAYDEAGNSATRQILVHRQGASSGAVIVIAGHNETFGLQTNIYNSTNRAYRIFQSAGFDDDNIYYLAPVDQDADDDGTPETDGSSNAFNVEYAITTWAKARVGPGKPLFIYMMDHGETDRFCVNGCAPGLSITPDDLDGWLRKLETDTGVDAVNVIYEACRSGSFVQRKNVTDSLSKEGRVIITSTGYDNNAYASAQGAYFSDAFFSCIADSGSLKACFNEARQAVVATGVNQTPFLDDNGDGVYNASDGTVAANRYITHFFSSVRPSITSTDVQKSGADGVLSATVDEGAESTKLVWAAVYGPSFTEPMSVTLNLDVPVVRLEPVPNQAGQFKVNYPNGFKEPGDYRIVYYAQDRLGINAPPKTIGGENEIFLPFVSNAQ